ncbi:hypothetical protein N7488_000800 [Penicillium malachiteum]|nr:hypothetical protein N7488_000800 [Penicillium malachiteum]
MTWDVIAPLISLYEVCGTLQQTLEGRCPKYPFLDRDHLKADPRPAEQANNYSYVRIATRDIYRESGCNFMLQPFTAQGVSYGDNITSVVFGVSERYTGDLAPQYYNFANTSSTDITSSATSKSPTGATSSSSSLTSISTSTTNAKSSHGMSKITNVGSDFVFH